MGQKVLFICIFGNDELTQLSKRQVLKTIGGASGALYIGRRECDVVARYEFDIRRIGGAARCHYRGAAVKRSCGLGFIERNAYRRGGIV